MKIFLATTAVIVAVSTITPATAQVYGDRWGDPAYGAYAQAPLTAQQRRNLARAQVWSPDGRIHSPNPAFDVYDTQGNYVSSDPDPFIRNELARVPPDRDDN
jgi:hypothetical protein